MHIGPEFHQLHTFDNAHAPRQAPLRRTLLAAALLSIGLHPQLAQALGLGPVTVQSAIGEPFRGEISLLGGSGDPLPSSSCFSLDRPASAGADDLPWLTAGRIRLVGRTAIISGPSPVNEPILMVGVRVGCGYEVVREYTVLMQPRTESAPATSEAVRSTRGDTVPRRAPAPSAATPSAARAASDAPAADEAAPPPRPPRKSRRAASAQPSGGDRLRVAPAIDFGDGLQMSGGLAPRAPASEAQREALRTEQKLLAALDEQIATHLAIADKVKQLESRLAELQKQLDRNSRMLDAAGAPPVTAPPAEPAAAPPPADTAPAAAESAPVTEENADTPAPVAGPAEDSAAEPSAPPEPPAGLTNEPVKVITKLPPDAAPEEDVAAGSGVNWMIASLGMLAAAAVLGGSWLWRRRAARLAEASAQRQRELEARIASEPRPRRRDQRSADADFAHTGEAPVNIRPADPAAYSSPAAAIRAGDDASTPAASGQEQVFEGEVVPPMDYVPPSDVEADPPFRTAEVSSIGYFPGEAPDEQVEHVTLVAPSSSSPADAPDAPADTPADTVPDLEFTPSSSGNVDFDIGQDEPPPDARPARLDLEFDTFVGSATSAGVADQDTTSHPVPRLVASNPGLSIDQSAAPANEEAAPSHEHVLELAEIMVSFGRAEGAAQTLSEFLRDYPKESLVPWLKLLDLYHKGGRRGEYDDLAPKLNRAFNVKVPDWEHFTGPNTSESVEQFAHIMARVNATWPNQDCLDYLTELIRDNRAGTRIGFPLGVIDDILLLRSVLEWLIANPPVTNTSASRLALL